MNPTRLQLRNYRCFDELDLDLPTGCVAVLGANGAGKSSIVGAIELALFGPESRSLADALSDTAGVDDDLSVELEFDHAGEVYRVRRTFSVRGRGKTTVDFEQLGPGWHVEPDEHGDPEQAQSPPEWEPLSRESAKATQELIEQTLGLSRETFRASAFLAQGDGAAFTEAQPRDRKRILAEILGLDRYDQLRERAAAGRRRREEELRVLDGRDQAAHELVAGKLDVEADHKEAVATAAEADDAVADREREHSAAQEEVASARAQVERRHAAIAELETVTGAHRQLSAVADAAKVARESEATAREELAQLTTSTQLDKFVEREVMLARLQESYHVAVVERETVKAVAAEASRRREDLRVRASDLTARAETLHGKATEVLEQLGDTAHCDRCGQTLGADAANRAAESYRIEADQLGEQAKVLGAELSAIEIPVVPDAPEPPSVDGDTVVNHLDRVRSQIAAARSEQAQRARLEERIANARKVVDSAPADLAEQLEQAAAAVTSKSLALAEIPAVDLAAVEAPANHAQARVVEARSIAAAAHARRARLDERLEQIANAERQVQETAAQRKAIAVEHAVDGALEQAFSPNGIPMLIVESTAIPFLETEASRILDEFGTSYRVELRTQAELKSGDGVRDTLDVIVVTEQGERAYETFSGGERTRLNLALRIALARLLAHRRGAESRLLCIDEPEFLDEQGTAALVDVLRGLQDDFDRIYLISHVPALRDSFDEVLIVGKDEQGRSFIGKAELAVAA